MAEVRREKNANDGKTMMKGPWEWMPDGRLGTSGFSAWVPPPRELDGERVCDYCGTIRKGADRRNIERVIDQVELVEMELTDAYSVNSAVHKARPDRVFHLAAQSFVPASWTSPQNTLDTNVIGTMNVLEAVRSESPHAYIHISGTSEEYGKVEGCAPIKEESMLRPLSPYGVSKVAADLVSYQYAESYGLNVCITRTFNQSGPRRGVQFFDSDWAKQLAEIEKGKRTRLVHGNLDVVRDLSDIRDTVQIYWKLANRFEPYSPKMSGTRVNVCSGIGYSMEAVLEMLLEMSTVPGGKIPTCQDPDRMRPSDLPWLIGDNGLLKKLIGEDLPHREYHETLRDLLDYWREQVK